ncbi:MAG: hypothetical protein U1A27_00275 [Phycisphaerae bacterium]
MEAKHAMIVSTNGIIVRDGARADGTPTKMFYDSKTLIEYIIEHGGRVKRYISPVELNPADAQRYTDWQPCG